MDAQTVLLWLFAVLLIGAGLIGLVVPALPGPLLLFAGFVLGAWADHFAYVGALTLIGLAFMALLMYLVDLAAAAFGAQRFGASGNSMIGAAVGMLVGLLFGLPGVLVGPFIGAAIGELTVRFNLKEAGRAGLGAWVGLALGTAAKLALAFAMVGVFVVVRFFH